MQDGNVTDLNQTSMPYGPEDKWGTNEFKKMFSTFKEATNYDDKYLGIDGYIGKQSIQLKTDFRIARSGNVYHEIWSKLKPTDKKWYLSGCKADGYVFVTSDAIYGIKINDLVELEIGMNLTKISDTSIGFLHLDVKNNKRKFHVRKINNPEILPIKEIIK